VLESIPAGSTVHVHTEQLNYIDHSCLDLMQEWISNSHNQSLTIEMEQDALEHKYWIPIPNSTRIA
jgi:hypothetical protein